MSYSAKEAPSCPIAHQHWPPRHTDTPPLVPPHTTYCKNAYPDSIYLNILRQHSELGILTWAGLMQNLKVVDIKCLAQCSAQKQRSKVLAVNIGVSWYPGRLWDILAPEPDQGLNFI